jgi:hypothetical protein
MVSVWNRRNHLKVVVVALMSQVSQVTAEKKKMEMSTQKTR